jgi:hypothetical protein
MNNLVLNCVVINGMQEDTTVLNFINASYFTKTVP